MTISLKKYHTEGGSALDLNCGVHRRVPARDRVESFRLLGPDLNRNFTVRDDSPILVGAFLLTLHGTIDRARDVVRELDEIILRRALHFYLLDRSVTVGIMELPSQVHRELSSESRPPPPKVWSTA